VEVRVKLMPSLAFSTWLKCEGECEVARRSEYDPAFQRLTGLAEVNYHTLADFRVEKQKDSMNCSHRCWRRPAREG
jgi:hypothetical protein